MKKSSWLTIGIIVLVIIVAALIIYFRSQPVNVDEQTAICIGENSRLYVQTGCPHCKDQEDMFGDYLHYLNITDCLYEQQACSDAGITSIPTWFINNQYYVGVQEIPVLQNLTGC